MKKKVLISVTLLCGALIALPWLFRAWVDWHIREQVYHSTESVPGNNVALVLGAGLWRDGSPGAVLHDRVVTAVELYQAGAVKKLLMSGDNRFESYNEPQAMSQLALELGVPDEDIVLDYAGRRTYDSCYRAKEIFGLAQVTVVTQRFHLNRALYLCDALGLKAIGVIADRQIYRTRFRHWWHLREMAALVKVWLDINLLHPQPILGKKLPIEAYNQSTNHLNR